MKDPVSDIEVTHTCPHLGIDSDPSSRCLFLTDSHRCFRGSSPKGMGDDHQVAYCLSEHYRSCPRMKSRAARFNFSFLRRMWRLPAWAQDGGH